MSASAVAEGQGGISMPVVRALVIALLMILAALFLAMGLGVSIPNLSWRSVPARDIPIGILLVFAGLAVARFWTVPQNEEKLMAEWQRRKHRG
jgi:hypothetical protein